MNEQEKKLYFVLRDSMHKMAEDLPIQSSVYPLPANAISFLGNVFSEFDWQRFKMAWDDHVCNVLGARQILDYELDSQESSDNFYVVNPSKNLSLLKPAVYFEIKKDIGLKILALGHVP